MPSYLYEKDKKFLPSFIRSIYSDEGVRWRTQQVITTFVKHLPAEWTAYKNKDTLCHAQELICSNTVVEYYKESSVSALPIDG